MCVTISKRFLSALVLLSLLPWHLSADYIITEEELTALEDILTRQEAAIETLQNELRLSQSIQNQLSSTLKQSDETITKLEQSLRQSVTEGRIARMRTAIISASIGLVVGYVTGQAITTF